MSSKKKKASWQQFLFVRHIHRTLLIVLLLAGIFFRFYNTAGRYSLGGDSTRDGLVAIEGAKILQLPLTGAFSSLGPFTFGPWFYYQLILFHLILPLSYSSWIYTGIASIVFIIVIYKIGEFLERKTFGLLASFFATFSTSQIATGTELSNPNLISVFAGLTVLLFLRLALKDLSYWWGFLFGFVLGVGINIHYQMTGLLILPLILLIYKPKKYLYFLTALAGIFVTFLPLLFFDLNNHWYTLRNMFYYYTEGRKAIYVPNRWLFYVRDFWTSYFSYALGLPVILGGILSALSFITPLWLLARRKLNRSWTLLFIPFFFNFILLRYYWGERGWGYLQYLYPFVFLFTGLVFWTCFKIRYVRYLGFTVLLLLFFLLLQKDINFLTPGDFQREIYREAAIIRKYFPDQKITLYNCGDSYSDRVQAISFLLTEGNIINDTGKKIGISNDQCPFPRDEKIAAQNLSSGEEVALLKGFYHRFDNDLITDFSSASEAAMLEAGWKAFTPRTVYDNTVRWWFKEQP